MRKKVYFLFLRSTPLFLGSFFAREDPAGIAYCIGEGIGPAAAAEVGTGVEDTKVLATDVAGAAGGAAA